MFTWLNRLNTNINLLGSLGKKLKLVFAWLKMRKLLTVSALIVLTVGGYFSYQRWRPKSPQELYQLAPVERQAIRQTVIASGKVKSQTQVDLKFQTSGLLTWVGVKEGDTVSAYQTLARLDSREVQKNLEKALRDYSNERNDFEESWRVTYDGKKIQDTVTDTVKRILEKNQWEG